MISVIIRQNGKIISKDIKSMVTEMCGTVVIRRQKRNYY